MRFGDNSEEEPYGKGLKSRWDLENMSDINPVDFSRLKDLVDVKRK